MLFNIHLPHPLKKKKVELDYSSFVVYLKNLLIPVRGRLVGTIENNKSDGRRGVELTLSIDMKEVSYVCVSFGGGN